MTFVTFQEGDSGMEKKIFTKSFLKVNYVRKISIMVIPIQQRVKSLFLCRQNNVYRTYRTVNKRSVCSVRDQSFSS